MTSQDKAIAVIFSVLIICVALLVGYTVHCNTSEAAYKYYAIQSIVRWNPTFGTNAEVINAINDLFQADNVSAEVDSL